MKVEKYIMKIKFIAIALIIACLSLVACSPASNDTTYTELGLTFTIPSNMIKSKMEDYEICYASYSSSFMAKKLDAKFFDQENLSHDTTAEEYVEFFFEINSLDPEQCEVKYDERQNAYKFHFSNSTDNVKYYFNYCVVITGSEGLWYVNMTCEHDNAQGFLSTFETWGNSLKVN
jgi:hypothetical protein